ncbi:hypothetical protein L1D13_10855 [Vibrio tubiashii]|uniref:hypothetical protein n=1 Tax=Vibrio tubiashii TaxID=29498 RepID=UPI001EFCD068|nr:hypothetical protein [Vibrio tubiashii]MCG9584629.1 hypothetical protein [Vibrio tubiashii]MCG9618157.1 hypothetical protein [Vibrio tubiashii]MCG9687422.1 hypothetical protein [Vibrio tubiashii]
MSEAALEQEFDLDGLDFSPELIADLEAIEPTPQPEAEQEEEAKQDYSGAKGEMTAEWMIEMIEAGFKSFINEDYALPDKKKAVIVNNFTPVLNKYDGGIVGLLGDYKEEGQVLFAVAILGFSMWMSVKEMKRKPVAPEGGEDGKK